MRKLVITTIALVMMASFGLGYHLSENGENRMNITNTTNDTSVNTVNTSTVGIGDDNQIGIERNVNRQAGISVNQVSADILELNDSEFDDYDIEYYGESVNKSDLNDANLTKWEIAEVFNLITIYDARATENKLLSMVNESEIVELLNDPMSRKMTFGTLVNFDVDERLSMMGILNETDTNQTRGVAIGTSRTTSSIGIGNGSQVGEANTTVTETNQTEIQNATEPEGDTRTQTIQTRNTSDQGITRTGNGGIGGIY